MKQPLYRLALAHAWQLVWQHKMLWFFGLFAALLGQMGIMEFLSRAYLATQGLRFSDGVGFMPAAMSEASSFAAYGLSAKGWIWLVWLLLLLAGIGAALFVAAVASQGALIHATAQSVRKRGKRIIQLRAAWDAGLVHFWRLAAINIFRFAVIGILAIIVTWATYTAMVEAGEADVILFLAIFVLAAVVGLAVSFITIYAAGYVVIEEYGLWTAAHAAWRLFWSHWVVSLEVGGILLLVNLVALALSLCGLLLFFFPAILIWVLAVALVNYTLFMIGAALASGLFLIFVLWLGSMFSVFLIATWTYMFLAMHEEGVTSRVLYWLAWQPK